MKVLNTRLLILLGFLVIYSCELINDVPDDADPRARIEGQWQCDESSQLYKSTEDIYWVYIDPDPNDSTRVIISNFYNLGDDIDVYAKINNSNLSISNQTTKDGYKVLSGSGSISSNYKQINWTYRIDDGSGEIDNVTATYTKVY
jgi:hypothetical protein